MCSTISIPRERCSNGMRSSSSASCWVCALLLKPKNCFSTSAMLGSAPGLQPNPMPLPISTTSRPWLSEAMTILLFSCLEILMLQLLPPRGGNKKPCQQNPARGISSPGWVLQTWLRLSNSNATIYTQVHYNIRQFFCKNFSYFVALHKFWRVSLSI